ncbi:hypothetical protein PMZ80_003806 [Knufia obscura]|nr:hypothetical protein PMZ80_003806 [Knufia obscura]
MSPLELYQLKLLCKESIAVLWKPNKGAKPVVLFSKFEKNVATAFCGLAQGMKEDGSLEIQVHGGKKESLTKMFHWMLRCCDGHGIIEFPITATDSMITLLEYKEAAQLLQIPWLIAEIDAHVKQRLANTSECIPAGQIAAQLRNLQSSDPRYHLLKDHVVERTLADMQTKYYQRLSDTKTKPNQDASQIALYQFKKPAGQAKQHKGGSKSRSPHNTRAFLPSDQYFTLKRAFPYFGKMVDKDIARLKRELYKRDKVAQRKAISKAERESTTAAYEDEAEMVERLSLR